MKVGILITQNGLELPCVIFPTRKKLFPSGEEVTVYCQNRLVKGYVDPIDSTIVAELNILTEWCIIPEFDEMIKERP